jgi:hypothetical protein
MADLTRMAFGTPMFSRRLDAGYMERYTCDATELKPCNDLIIS